MALMLLVRRKLVRPSCFHYRLLDIKYALLGRPQMQQIQ